MTAGFVALGVGTIVFASQLDRRLGGPGRSGLGPLLLGLSGVATTAAGVLRRDRMSNYPMPGDPRSTSHGGTTGTTSRRRRCVSAGVGLARARDALRARAGVARARETRRCHRRDVHRADGRLPSRRDPAGQRPAPAGRSSRSQSRSWDWSPAKLRERPGDAGTSRRRGPRLGPSSLGTTPRASARRRARSPRRARRPRRNGSRRAGVPRTRPRAGRREGRRRGSRAGTPRYATARSRTSDSCRRRSPCGSAVLELRDARVDALPGSRSRGQVRRFAVGKPSPFPRPWPETTSPSRLHRRPSATAGQARSPPASASRTDVEEIVRSSTSNRGPTRPSGRRAHRGPSGSRPCPSPCPNRKFSPIAACTACSPSTSTSRTKSSADTREKPP